MKKITFTFARKFMRFLQKMLSSRKNLLTLFKKLAFLYYVNNYFAFD